DVEYFSIEVDRAALLVFCGTGIEAYCFGMQVHPIPRESQNLLLAPAGIVRKGDHRSQCYGEGSSKCHELTVLKKSSPDIALLEHGNIGFVADLGRALLEGEVEHTLEGSQLAVDLRISVAVFLPRFDIGPDLIGRDIHCAHPPKEALQMFNA